jgi:hypothetical protein
MVMIFSFGSITKGGEGDLCVIANRHRRLAAQHKREITVCGASVFSVSYAKT